ncbi:hypothetical protein EJ08DRAFT_708416, partial [Tothia fuscella]
LPSFLNHCLHSPASIVDSGCPLINLLYLGSKEAVPRVSLSSYLQSSLMHGFAYSPSILCPRRIRVCSISLIAVVAKLREFRIARRLFRPGKRPSSSLRIFLYLRQYSRTWATVCRPSRQSYRGSGTPGTRRLKRKSLRPIFSVRICTRSALSLLLRSLWS